MESESADGQLLIRSPARMVNQLVAAQVQILLQLNCNLNRAEAVNVSYAALLNFLTRMLRTRRWYVAHLKEWNGQLRACDLERLSFCNKHVKLQYHTSCYTLTINNHSQLLDASRDSGATDSYPATSILHQWSRKYSARPWCNAHVQESLAHFTTDFVVIAMP